MDIHFSLLLLYILIVTHVEELPSGVGTRLGGGGGKGVSLLFYVVTLTGTSKAACILN